MEFMMVMDILLWIIYKEDVLLIGGVIYWIYINMTDIILILSNIDSIDRINKKWVNNINKYVN